MVKVRMPMLDGKKTLKNKEVAEVEGQEKGKEWQLEVGGRDISFDYRLLNTILRTPENGIRFYTKNKKCFDPNLYSERRFEELFTKFVITLVLEKSTTNIPLKEMVFSKNEEDMLVRGRQDDNNESDEDDERNEEKEAMNMDEEESLEEHEEETCRREMRQNKRQEQVEEGQSFVSVCQLMDMIASLQVSMNSRFDALDGKISDIQERVYKKNKRYTKGVSRVIYKEAKDQSRLQDFMKMK
ncbi:hypothetical protein M9H77_02742 [Catharanthus roseus]|uniref:Uncharacterized protein n=1 Tax=Catharanthus roseus TaxID=4058 RepID=A0ACC0C986_CATRO|nr:hypothetical protein M9H77_02742 [Catharanthus roseus]